MSFGIYHPTRIFFGGHCVTAQSQVWKTLGQKALVVTGKSSSAKNGSLPDLEKSLKAGGVAYEIFSGVEPDPGFETVRRGAEQAIACGADLVIGVGGGSAIDAAKAMAVLTANPGMTPEQLFEREGAFAALPIAAIPTTAGTGTEVTPYSVLTDHAHNTKRAFRNEAAFPKLALVDAAYTLELPLDVTRDTAVDALSHLLEGYISKKANVLTDTLAEKGLLVFRECMDGLAQDALNRGLREKLMLASLLGGLVIATAGTATVHALGYPLTFYHGIPHGRANGYLLTSQMKRCAAVSSKSNRVLSLLRLEHWDAFQAFLEKVLPGKLTLPEAVLRSHAEGAVHSKNHLNNPYEVDVDLLFEMLKENFA